MKAGRKRRERKTVFTNTNEKSELKVQSFKLKSQTKKLFKFHLPGLDIVLRVAGEDTGQGGQPRLVSPPTCLPDR